MRKGKDAVLRLLRSGEPVQFRQMLKALGVARHERGMLEDQLERLFEALTQAWPEGRERAQVLLEAAGRRKDERFQWLPEPRWEALVQDFQRATQGELAGTGALILSAACDHASGIAQAVPALRSWLSDPKRFPPAWVAAVRGLFDQALTAVP